MNGDRTSWYFVCDRCNAKWFFAGQRIECPRCGLEQWSDEAIVPPWQVRRDAQVAIRSVRQERRISSSRCEGDEVR